MFFGWTQNINLKLEISKNEYGRTNTKADEAEAEWVKEQAIRKPKVVWQSIHRI